MRIHTVQQLGTAIRQARKQRGLTQTELGKLAGMHQTKVCNIENGKGIVAFASVLRLLAGLGVDLTLLMALPSKRLQGPAQRETEPAATPAPPIDSENSPECLAS